MLSFLFFFAIVFLVFEYSIYMCGLQFTKAYCGLFNEAGVPPKRKLTCYAVTPDAAIQPGQLLSMTVTT